MASEQEVFDSEVQDVQVQVEHEHGSGAWLRSTGGAGSANEPQESTKGMCDRILLEIASHTFDGPASEQLKDSLLKIMGLNQKMIQDEEENREAIKMLKKFTEEHESAEEQWGKTTRKIPVEDSDDETQVIGKIKICMEALEKRAMEESRIEK